MHLLVLSAFRPKGTCIFRHCFVADNVSMHLLVLSAFRHPEMVVCGYMLESQCTFWCSVLSDLATWTETANGRSVSMHLLVLSAFRHTDHRPTNLLPWGLNAPFGAQCFPTFGCTTKRLPSCPSQCTFWCSVLSDLPRRTRWARLRSVSMHLLVLSAFRQELGAETKPLDDGLNAPFGAQCFPTRMRRRSWGCRLLVSMHLLVLSAFRLKGNLYYDFSQWSQCTFWCSVLSDPKRKLLIYCFSSLNAPFGAQCFPT